MGAQSQKVLDRYRRLYQPRPTHPVQVSGNTKEEEWEECKSQRTGRKAMKVDVGFNSWKLWLPVPTPAQEQVTQNSSMNEASPLSEQLSLMLT